MIISADTIAISAAHAGPGSGPGQGAGDPVPVLSIEELKVLTCMGLGTSRRSTAHNLGISRHACRGLRRSLGRKLAAADAAETVSRGRHFGLIGAA